MDNLALKKSNQKKVQQPLTTRVFNNLHLPLSDSDFNLLMTSPWPTIERSDSKGRVINMDGIPRPLLKDFSERFDKLDVSYSSLHHPVCAIAISEPRTWMDYLSLTHSGSVDRLSPKLWEFFNNMYDSWMEMISILHPSITWPED